MLRGAQCDAQRADARRQHGSLPPAVVGDGAKAPPNTGSLLDDGGRCAEDIGCASEVHIFTTHATALFSALLIA